MKQKILIAEDDFTIQAQLKNLLSGNGYEVCAVTDFSKTIEQVKAFTPHLILLDIKLLGNNGFEICSQIRAFSDMPIVFVTSSNTDMDELFKAQRGLAYIFASVFVINNVKASFCNYKRACFYSSSNIVSFISGKSSNSETVISKPVANL